MANDKEKIREDWVVVFRGGIVCGFAFAVGLALGMLGFLS